MEEQEKIFKELHNMPINVAFDLLISFVIVNSLTARFAEFYKEHKLSRGIDGKDY